MKLDMSFLFELYCTGILSNKKLKKALSNKNRNKKRGYF